MLHHIEPEFECCPLLISKLNWGDIEAFQQCYQVFYPLLKSSAIELQVEARHGDVIIQHAIIKLWLSSRKITSTDYIEGFLRITVMNACQMTSLPSLILSNHQDGILRQILEIRQGNSRQELFSHFQLLAAAEKQGIRLVFERYYEKRQTAYEIAKEFGIEKEQVQDKLNLAYQVLHLILSLGPT